jgi:two-component system nitrate/nitrite sensor histidine kinase NarX
MSLARLRWLTILTAISFLVLVQGIAMGVVMPTFGISVGHAVSIGAFSVGVIVLTTLLYATIDRMQARIVRQNEESEALYEIAVDIAGLDDEREVLRSIVDRAREMLHADAAALCLAGPNGALNPTARTGIPEAFRLPARSSDEPVPVMNGKNGNGRAGNGCPLANPAFAGVSEDLIAGGQTLGEICVSSATAREFDEEERRLLRAMADLAAIAVQKSRLMERGRQAAVLEERERLAREMHDSLAQVLGYLHLKSEGALTAADSGKTDVVRRDLAEISSVSHEAYADVREAILGLRETVSQRRGFVDALRVYTTKFSQMAGIPTQLEMRGSETLMLAPEAEVQLMRVIQEALTNVRKHAGAKKACVSLEQGEVLRITIEDDGKGFDPAQQNGDEDHFGLYTMRERVERVGGRIAIDSDPGRGTRVCVTFPDGEAET